MVTTILSTILASTLLVTSIYCAPASPASLTQFLPENNYVVQVVESDQTLGDFALVHYGDVNQWTTVWNDNPWIESPNTLKKGWLLSVRADKPLEPEELVANVKLKAVVASNEVKAAERRLSVPTFPQMTVVVPVVNPVSSPKTLSDEQINFLGKCEAGMDPAKNTGNGYYGAFQFSHGTWQSMNTGYARADLAPLEVQKEAVQRLVQRSSIHTQFPGCASRMRGAGLI